MFTMCTTLMIQLCPFKYENLKLLHFETELQDTIKRQPCRYDKVKML